MGRIKKQYYIYREYVRRRHPRWYNFFNKHKTIYKFISSGAISSTVDLGLLYALTEWVGVYYLISSCIAFVSAFLISFSLQKYWTFRDNTTHRIYQQAAMYFGVGIFNVFFNIVVMYLLVEHLNVWYMFSQILVGGFISINNFVLYKLVIFKKIRKEKIKEIR